MENYIDQQRLSIEVISTPIEKLIEPIITRGTVLTVPEHEETPEEETAKWAREIQQNNDKNFKRAEEIFEILKLKREALESDGKIQQMFLLCKGDYVKQCTKVSRVDGTLLADVLLKVDEKGRLMPIYSFSEQGTYPIKYDYEDNHQEKKTGYDHLNKDERIVDFRGKKGTEKWPIIDLKEINDINSLKELIISRTKIHNLNNNCFERFDNQKKSRSNKKVYKKQTSIEAWELNSAIERALAIANFENITHANNITDELAKLETKKTEKPQILPVQEEWLHPNNIVTISSGNLISVREQIKSLVKEELIDPNMDNKDKKSKDKKNDICNIDDDKLIDQLVCFQSGTPFHNFKTGPAILRGNILAIPIKTPIFYDKGSGNFLYVGNIDIKNTFRKSKSSNIYGVPYMNKQFRAMKIGLQIHVEDHRAIEVKKADINDDRSLIQSKEDYLY